MKPIAKFLSTQNEVAEQFLSNTRFSLKNALTPSEKYEVVVDVCRSFADNFAAVVPPLEEWSDTVESAEEEYLPSGPPMSPVTHYFFVYWSVSDLQFGPEKETLAECVEALLSSSKPNKSDQLVLSLISNIASSQPGVYEVTKSNSRQTELRDIVDDRTFRCDPSSAKKGELWLTRLLPYPEDDTRHFTATEPYLLQGFSKQEWLRMLLQASDSRGLTIEELLKFGHSQLSWLEYLHQSYLGIKGEFIALCGNLTDPRTRPHSDGEDLSPRYRVPGLALPVLEFQLTPAQRKIVARKFPDLEPELELKKSGRRRVVLEPEQVGELRGYLFETLPNAKGPDLAVGRSLAQELDEKMKELAAVVNQHLDEDDGEVYEWLVEAKELLFRFTLKDTEVEVVRHVKVPAIYDLLDLHGLLQIVFGWDNSHLHYFEIDGDRFSHPEGVLEDCYDEEDLELSRIFSDTLEGEYYYDMGDSWRVSIEVLRGYDWGDGLPLLVAGEGPNPVDDCGGTPGFEELLRLLSNPKLKDPAGRRELVDDNYDPRSCPEREIQRRLIETFRDDWGAEGLELYVRRHPVESFNVQGEPTDVIIAVESEELLIVGCRPCLRSDDPKVAVEAVREALGKVRQPEALVVDDKGLAQVLKKNFDLKVKTRRSIPELNSVVRDMEAHLSRGRSYFGNIPQEILSDFVQATQRYYLNPLWRKVSDSELFLVEGLTPQPLVLSILGNAGEEHGLSVFEEVDSAIAMFDGRLREVDSYFFLTYEEDWEAVHPRQELKERELPTLPDSAPLILSPRGLGQTREYRLMTDLLSLLPMYKIGGKKKQVLAAGERGTITVTWPLYPPDLEKLKSKQNVPVKSKLGRNDPCWCGSGKKYKKCHLGKD